METYKPRHKPANVKKINFLQNINGQQIAQHDNYHFQGRKEVNLLEDACG